MKRLSKILLFVVILLSLVLDVSAQNAKKKKQHLLGTNTLFGFRYSYSIAGNFVQKNDIIKETDSSFYNVKYSSGYVFGAEVRHNFTKYFGIQTGISFVRRNYNVFATVSYTEEPTPGNIVNKTDSNETQLHFIAYDIPIKAIYYIRLANIIYMNLSAGPNIEFYPSDIYYERFYGQRKSWVSIAFDFDLGWEVRTKNTGTFHIGLGYKMMANDILHIVYTNKWGGRVDYLDVSGNYFSFDLKYYFPNDRSR